MTFEQFAMEHGLIINSLILDKWVRVYCQLMMHRIKTPPAGYSEQHHILPKSMGGSNNASNLVRLTGREHFVAHLLLARIYGGKMWAAVLRMKGGKSSYVNSRLYDRARQRWAQWSSENQRGKNHWAYGKPSPHKGVKKPEFSGINHPNFGKKLTTDRIDALVNANTGKKRSTATRQKISAAQLGDKNHRYGKETSPEVKAVLSQKMKERILTSEHKERIGQALKGRVFSEATRQKMREAALKRKAREKNGLPPIC
jgi:hypothetical protein